MSTTNDYWPNAPYRNLTTGAGRPNTSRPFDRDAAPPRPPSTVAVFGHQHGAVGITGVALESRRSPSLRHGVDDFQELEPMEVRIPRIDHPDPMLAHQHRGM